MPSVIGPSNVEADRALSRRWPSIFFVLIAAVVSASVTGWLYHSPDATDVNGFAEGGRELLSQAWLHTYHDQWIQAGPIELLVCFFAKSVGRDAAGAAIVLNAITALAIVGAAFFVYGRNIRAVLIALAMAVLLGVVRAVGEVGHIAEPAAALLWLFAARDARSGRAKRAGVLVGASAGFEIWGVLGLPVVFLAERVRDWTLSCVIAISVAATFYAPFALGGDFRMFHQHWAIAHTAPALIGGVGTSFTWAMRLAQAAAVVLIGVACARLTRKWELSTWITPGLTFFVRLMTDPIRFDYYWGLVLTLIAIGVSPWIAEPKKFVATLEAQVTRRRASVDAA